MRVARRSWPICRRFARAVRSAEFAVRLPIWPGRRSRPDGSLSGARRQAFSHPRRKRPWRKSTSRPARTCSGRWPFCKTARLAGRLGRRSPRPSSRPSRAVGPEGDTRGKVLAQVRRKPLLLAGLAGGLVLLLAAVLTFTLRGGTLTVEIDEQLGKDVHVAVRQGGQEIQVVDAKSGWTLSLSAGKYDLSVRGGDDKFQLDTQSVTVSAAVKPRSRSRSSRARRTTARSPHTTWVASTRLPRSKLRRTWQAGKDFAEISSAGEIAFPKIPACRYVLETELTIGNAQNGRIIYRIADGGYGTDLSLGVVWPQDRTVTTVPCRLFGTNPSGGIAWVGERQFAIGQRLALKLFAADEARVLFCNGKRVTNIDLPPLDLTLKILAEGTPDCTIHTCSVRPLNESDMPAIGHVVTPYDLKLAPEKTARRIREQTNGLATVAETGKPFLVKSIDAAMRWIPAGQFTMGGDAEYDETGKGKHRVRLSRGFWIGQYTVTQEQWLRLFRTNPSRFRGSPYLPVHWVSWEDAVQFCEELDSRERKAGRLPAGCQYRLPTEAEWEYACKAGSDEDQPNKPPEGWWRANAGRRLHEVGELPPNGWGLYDMCGNAAQWCLDVWQPYPAESDKVLQDPCRLRESKQDRLCLRGGGWWRFKAEEVQPISRDSSRSVAAGYNGFRIVLGKTLTGAK